MPPMSARPLPLPSRRQTQQFSEEKADRVVGANCVECRFLNAAPPSDVSVSERASSPRRASPRLTDDNGSRTRNCAPPSGRLPAEITPLCETITFCTMARPESGARGLGRRERLKEAVQRLASQARAVVIDDHVDVAADTSPVMTMRGAMPRGRARFQAVAKQVAERLPQQHVVAVDRAELAFDRDRLGAAGQILDRRGRSPRADRPAPSRAVRVARTGGSS